MIREYIGTVAEGRHLTQDDAANAMGVIMRGEATPAQIAALLVALRMKGETVEELTGFAHAMRTHALVVRCSAAKLVDTCGTGGDGLKTFNVSTGAALVVAGAGVAVAKHGNRAMSSACGAFDVVEALGLPVSLTPEAAERCLEEAGIAFLFAQAFHPAMKHAAPVRREIGVRTLFNLLGPLTNPAGAHYQVIGVPRAELTEPIARVLAGLGSRGAWVVHGEPGLDELSTLGPTRVTELRNGEVRSFTIDAASLGLPRAEPQDVAGGDAPANAARLLAVLRGEPGPPRDLVLLNAAAALVVAEEASDLREGLARAARSIDSGAALGKLEALRAQAG